MPAPKLVVFDIGNVLVKFDFRNVYADLLSDPPDDDPFVARVGLHEMNERGDLGELRPQVDALADQFPEDAALIRPWFDRWQEMFTPAIPGTADILMALRGKGVRVAALTNFASDTFATAQQMYPELGRFDIEVVSGRENLAKPDPRFYEVLEARSGCSGADIFFTDDRSENIEAARARGWHTYHFGNAQGLSASLAEAGLTVG